MPKYSDKTDLDHLAKMFDIPTYDVLEERNYDYVMEQCNGAGDMADDDEQREAAIQKCEDEVRSDYFHTYHNALISAVDDAFDKADIAVVPRGKYKNNRYPFEYKFEPKTSWADSASKILDIINGVGEFEFANLKEFLQSGPYTAREAVLSHIGYVADYHDVYGDTSPKRRWELAMD